MPVVPFAPQPPKGRALPTEIPADQESWVLMAAAQMDSEGRLLQGGQYIGELGQHDDLSFDRSEAIGRRNGDKIERSADPKDIMKKAAPDEEGYTLPNNPHLFIRKKKSGKGNTEDLVS